jgi:hypothetical protein
LDPDIATQVDAAGALTARYGADLLAVEHDRPAHRRRILVINWTPDAALVLKRYSHVRAGHARRKITRLNVF